MLHLLHLYHTFIIYPTNLQFIYRLSGSYKWWKSFNPYRQIPETISKKTGGDSGDIPETFSRFCNFGAWLNGFSGNFFQVNFMSTYPWKNIFFPKTGHDSEAFPENFSRRISYATSQEKVFINTFWWHLGLK